MGDLVIEETRGETNGRNGLDSDINVPLLASRGNTLRFDGKKDGIFADVLNLGEVSERKRKLNPVPNTENAWLDRRLFEERFIGIDPSLIAWMTGRSINDVINGQNAWLAKRKGQDPVNGAVTQIAPAKWIKDASSWNWKTCKYSKQSTQMPHNEIPLITWMVRHKVPLFVNMVCWYWGKCNWFFFSFESEAKWPPFCRPFQIDFFS